MATACTVISSPRGLDPPGRPFLVGSLGAKIPGHETSVTGNSSRGGIFRAARQRIIDAGIPMLNDDELRREITERRGLPLD